MFKRAVTGAAVLGFVLLSSPASLAVWDPDAVMEWNEIALAATVTANQGPVPQLRSMAIVQVAVHDAVNVITQRHARYLAGAQSQAGASAKAAAIAAAHRTLATLFPAQAATLNGLRASSLANHDLTEDDPGIDVGEAAAAAMLAARADDGASVAQFPYTAPGAGTPGVFVPIGTQQALLPGWRDVTTWVIHSGSQFRPAGPPELNSGRYARDYNEIKELGSVTSQTRTAEQTEIGRFWLGSPAAIWNSVARGVLGARNPDISDAARTFALMYLAAADASVTCWDAKYTYNFWRPQAAIRNGDLDDNARTEPDSTWTPLFSTPPHPEYLSGHSTNSAAMATALEMLFGDDPGVPIIATSPTNAGFPREWSTFSEGIDEVIDARIYSGIHFRSADEVGARVGRQVARFVVRHALR